MTQDGSSRAARFSIVVPAYQAAGTLADTLHAIANQKYENWECVVVDDGSTDETFSIASAYGALDPRIRVLHKDNGGTASAYNTGVGSASGEFVVLCSADDVLLPEHLQRMATFIDTEVGYDIYTSNGYLWRPGSSREPIYEEGRSAIVHSLDLADVIRVCFYGVGAAYRREWFEKLGGYRLGIFGEDYDFWLRAMALGARHRYLPEALSLFRVSPTQKSAQLETAWRSDIKLVSELRRDFPLSAEESRVVDEAIRNRERLIAGLNIRPSFYRRRVRPVVRRIGFQILGRHRARSVWRGLKSWIRRVEIN
jgi:glycosyltransferase involved in cell wall biosynthesis